MSGFGILVNDASGAVQFDSTTAVGGVVIDFRRFSPTDAAVYTYPEFAGYTAFFVNVWGDGTIVLDTALGYPRVTVSTSSNDGRTFILAVY